MEEHFGKRRCATKAGKLVFLYVLLTMAFGPAPVCAAMTDLGTLGGTSSSAIAINKTGRVVGWSFTSSQDLHAIPLLQWHHGGPGHPGRGL